MRPSELPWKYINKKVVRIYFDHLEKKVCVGGGGGGVLLVDKELYMFLWLKTNCR